MICKLPPRRALWQDSANYRVYVHRSGAVEIERLRDLAAALLPPGPGYTFACRVAMAQRGDGGAMTDAALDRLCGDFDHVVDQARERARPTPGVVLELMHARAS